MTAISLITAAAVSYLAGTINPAYIIAKLKGFDIRTLGSNNAGGSNAVITMGGKIGAFCIFFDIFKAWLSIFLLVRLLPENPYIYPISAVCAVLGHCFPFYMKFDGGKGFACLAGLVLAYNWKVFLILLLVCVVILITTRYLFLLGVTASSVFPLIYYFMTHNYFPTLILVIIPIIICTRHRANFANLKKGEEIKIDYLWKKDEEIKRTNKITKS